MKSIAVVVACIASAACSSGKGRVSRDKDAAPVVMVGPGSGAVGAPRDEKEPNNTTAEATAVVLGGTTRGSLDGASDVDAFAIEVAGNGALKVALTGIDGVDLALEIVDGAGTVLAKSDRGPAAISEGVPNLGVVKGTYFAVVKEFVKPAKGGGKKKKKVDAAPAGGRLGPSPTYELVATVSTPADYTEREPDDDQGAANSVNHGDTVTGFIGWSGDVDVWKLSLEAFTTRNAFDVEVTAVDGVALTVEILDATGNPVQTRKVAKGLMVALRAVTFELAEGSAPFHYIKVAGDRSNPETAYQLAVRPRLLDIDEEAEPNDKRDKAMKLIDARGTIRATYVAGDVDCLAIDPKADPQSIEIITAPPDGVDAIVELVSPTATLARADAGGAGGTETLAGTLPPGTFGAACTSFKPVKNDTGAPRDYSIDYAIAVVADSMPPEE